MLKEFREFALKGNVVDLAVGIIIGAAFTGIVQSLVNDVIMPPIGVLMGGIDFSNYFLVLKSGEAPASLSAAKDAGIPVLAYGKFVNALINFAIVAWALFFVVRQMNALRRRFEEAPAPKAPAAPPRQEVLLEEIRDLLKDRSGG
ncbi:large-conductance mechanosensitive channel [Thalassobaculum fulvum]|jgi:large conductance mechanosensitive channel|uniref:Large-conductance mechanosensitive channel n=1 Tax=Thalassobaculum fulvum TaxID=1633335 RepID=A0A918XV87_9PROT|nr:large conductance mechanosensitive channel protein MscL [Thalassobaculum fulvum]GHD56563.1 large-conductance mechanosensitive channel [Thalassobaculum fulvum]